MPNDTQPQATSWPAALYLENGHLFFGTGYGSQFSRGGEAVFNTGMSGYQEIFTDPSYKEQIVVMGYPHIGNTGINKEDWESSAAHLSGVVVREYCATPSNWRSSQTLHEWLAEHDVPLISGVDTREITRILRDEGAQRAVIFPIESWDVEKIRTVGKDEVNEVPPMEGLELVSQVSCTSPYRFEPENLKKETTHKGCFVVMDFGVKSNILRNLYQRGFEVQVVPHSTSAKEIKKYNPVGVLLSNGPGDPATVSGDTVEQIKSLVGDVPLFAICMGHQLLARALGANTFKLKFGHHGINHPVKDLRSGRVLITSQNHGFAVSEEDLIKHNVEITHKSLNDGTVQGFGCRKRNFFSVQFHPEAAPGPSDGKYLFDEFAKGLTA